MKKYFLSLVFYLICILPATSQKIPNDIKKALDSLQAETRKGLQIYRTDWDSCRIASGLIQWRFLDDMRVKVLKMKLKLDLGMIYDNDMRNRVLQLLKNEYQPEELDTLANRSVSRSLYNNETVAFEICKFDTLSHFKQILDSFYNEEKRLHPKDHSYKYFYNYNVFKIMKLDTTIIFKRALEVVNRKDKSRFIFDLKNDNFGGLPGIAELCGYINDKRFIKPLIAALDKPNNFQKQSVIKGLAMMKVEPYYSTLLKENTISLKEIEEGKIKDYNILTEVLRSQESFLELSKYLKSNKVCRVADTYPEEYPRQHGDELKFCIFQTIYNNLENIDLKRDFGNGADKIYTPYPAPPEYDELIEKLYIWMQKNYGNYKISWYHY